jgi:hypothetical protein
MITITAGSYRWTITYTSIGHHRPWVTWRHITNPDGTVHGASVITREATLGRAMMVLAEDVLVHAGDDLIEPDNATPTK